MNLLSKDDRLLVASYRDRISELGLIEYVKAVGKETYMRVYELFNTCIYGLVRNLENEESFAFRLGMHYGRYVFLLEIKWLSGSGKSKNFLYELQGDLEDANSEYIKALKYAQHLDQTIFSNLEDLSIEKKAEMAIGDYREKLYTLAAEIIDELRIL